MPGWPLVGTASVVGTQRDALQNHDLVRHTTAQLLGITAEVMIVIGVLVDTYNRAGARATGIASIALLAPFLVVAPFAGALATRYPPQRVRVLGFAGQVGGYGAAAIAASLELSIASVVVAAAIGSAAATTMRPTAAMVLPAIVRSSRELTVGNVWDGHTETISQLGGALTASLLLAVGGPATVISACALFAGGAAAVLVVPRPIDPPASPVGAPERLGSIALAVDTVRDLHTRRGAVTVLAIAGAQFIVLGALDIIIVVAASDTLGLGDSGAGWLYTAVGVGAVASGLVATVLARRRRQAPSIAAALAACAATTLLLSIVLTPVAAIVLLAFLGLTRSLIDVLANILLHRSIRPERLGSVYALLEFASGAGLIVGSLIAQVAIAIGGPRLALVAVGVVLLATLFLSWNGLKHADAAADVPVTAMRLLQRVSLFAPLPQVALEDVARSAAERGVSAGVQLTIEGEPGDEYFVVSDGEFDVTIAGETVRTIGRGGGFGEIALLGDVARTATVTATVDSTVLSIHRAPFLVAVTGHDSSRQAAWGVMRAMGHDMRIDEREGARPPNG